MRQCELCGAYLDAGERCDCMNEKGQLPEGIATTNNNIVSKAIKLVKLELHNFQGITERIIELNGRSADIFGDNATGKTTVFNAFTWLLFDKASTGAKGFTPKTKTADGELHRVEHSAVAVFDVAHGTLTLRKVYREVYKKKRGNAHEDFDGHTTDYYVDGVPMKEKEYTAEIEKHFADLQTVMLLTMPDYFPSQLAWDKRREILLDVCGDCTDAQVFNSNAELAELPEILGTHSVDDYTKIANAKKRELNKKIGEIPVRIDELKRSMPTIAESDDSITTQIQAAQSVIDNLLIQKQGMTAESELARLKTERENAKAAHIAAWDKARFEHEREYRKRVEQINNEQLKQKQLKGEIDILRSRVEGMKAERERLQKEWQEVFEQIWNDEQSVCPTCHRMLPSEDIDELKAAFNRKKSERLQTINERGKQTASITEIEKLEHELAAYEQTYEARQHFIDGMVAGVEVFRADTPKLTPFEETEACLSIDKQIASLQVGVDTSDIDRQLEKHRAEVERLQALLAQQTTARAAAERITQLERELHDLTAEYERTEREIYLCELFVKTKVEMLTERINGRFERVRFSLFSEQLNGGLKPECEVLIPSESGSLVPYQYANNAAKINAGLEIINTLAEHYGIALPVFVDNAESVTKLAEIQAQVIRLIVSENDKELRVEVEK